MEEQLRSFFVSDVESRQASLLRQMIEEHIPAMKRYPHIVVAEVHRFRKLLDAAPVFNREPALKCLLRIAGEVPESRWRIAETMGDVLYALVELGGRQVREYAMMLLQMLDVAPTPQDKTRRDLARSCVTLKQHVIIVIGAGFSYEQMPVTTELKPILFPLLKSAGVDRPAELIHAGTAGDAEAWSIARQHQHDFKLMFAATCAGTRPSPQHFVLAKLIDQGWVRHLVSFNWDNLCERAFEEEFSRPLHKVTREGGPSDGATLWKLHGDVEDLNSEWVFPYESGRVFDSLLASLDASARNTSISHALIVGYSESESEVQRKLVRWLEANVPSVVRVRPNVGEPNERRFAETARQFFERLAVHIEIERRRSRT
jgi:hypothetical protein